MEKLLLVIKCENGNSVEITIFIHQCIWHLFLQQLSWGSVEQCSHLLLMTWSSVPLYVDILFLEMYPKEIISDKMIFAQRYSL